MTLLVHLIFFSLPNMAILGMIAIPFAKATLSREYFNIFDWLLMMPRGTQALRSSTEPLYTFLEVFFSHPYTGSENEKRRTLI
jgi:hypothetical protein